MAKIEVVKQQDIKDCGACSLSCIIKYYDGYVPLEKIREDTYTNINGTTAYHLINAAKNYGFDAVGVKTETIEDKNIYLPAIAHVVLKNGYNHFVVIYKITKNDIWLMDPAKGKVKLSKKEFLDIWDNILILLTPNTNIIKFEQNLNIHTLLINLILKNKNIFINVCIINILLMIFTILNSFYFQITITSIQNEQDSNYLKFIIIFFLNLVLLKVIFTFLKNYYLNYFNKNLDVEIFSSFLNHIFHLPLKFMQNRTTGEVVSRVQELSEIKNLLADFFTNILLNSVLIIGSSIVLFLLNSKLFLILVGIIIFYLLIGILLNKLIYPKIKENIEVATDFNSVLVENIEMNTSIKNLDLTDNFLKRLEDKLIVMLKSNFNTNKNLNWNEFIKDYIYDVGLFIVMSFGFYLVYKGELNVLSLVTFNSILYYLLPPIKEIINLLPRYNYLKASFNKLKDFINIPEEENKNGLTKISKGDIIFENVSYSYNAYVDIIKNINLKINAGEKVLLNGVSGSGKSTICNLIIRNESNYRGMIKLDKTSVADYSLGTIRKEITYVGQNEKLFSGTIKDNIICDRSISDEEFLNIAKICNLEEIVAKRPNRYQTFINASLNNLSGGEKQRIILARALLKKAKILILDEALSEVNKTLELEIINNIKSYFKENTLIYISHKNVQREFNKIINLGVTNDTNI